MSTVLVVLLVVAAWIGLNIAVATALARAFRGRPERRSPRSQTLVWGGLEEPPVEQGGSRASFTDDVLSGPAG
jgi:hypothetical protein